MFSFWTADWGHRDRARGRERRREDGGAHPHRRALHRGRRDRWAFPCSSGVREADEIHCLECTNGRISSSCERYALQLNLSLPFMSLVQTWAANMTLRVNFSLIYPRSMSEDGVVEVGNGWPRSPSSAAARWRNSSPSRATSRPATTPFKKDLTLS